ncbi:hypothetical protein B0T10DRAFT_547459 [Thelonectria olida]|uniref:Uncharacterized protein n=1 Tax=Thelonectria olida TaxID=1576542 RepID=A0A9P8W549_9HYPO|nr:hypothetical protein B0T10DRAFT_547459 [Thelonectria olida]
MTTKLTPARSLRLKPLFPHTARFSTAIFASSRTSNLSLHTIAPAAAPARYPSTRYLSTTRSLNMASDEDYMAFLNKANQDTGSATAQSSEKPVLKTKDEGSEVPKEIRDVCQQAVYVSEADEPFEEVSLKWDGKHRLPTESEFAELTKSPSDATISIIDPLEWDSKGQYTDVLEAVRRATQGNDVRVYRVERDATRVEYWLVSSKDGKLVGAKALSIES